MQFYDLKSLVHSGRAGSSPATSTTSPQTLYRLRRFFHKSSLIHAGASPFPSEPDTLGFALGKSGGYFLNKVN
jgi:hypothetical protein